MNSVPPHADSDAGPDQQGKLHKTLGQKICITAVLCLLVASLVLLLWWCCLRAQRPTVPLLPPAPATIRMPPVIKVVLAESRSPLSVSCGGGGTWYGLAEGAPFPLQGGGPGPWVVSAGERHLTINGKEQPCSAAELRPARLTFRLGKRRYRGSLIVQRIPEGGVTALNVVKREAYLRSVVGSEMYARWPLDALMAQAVAARTFMLYALSSKGHMSRVDMAYKGTSAECRGADLAVDLTREIILTYEGKLLPAYFHSTCGGHTAPVGKVFNEPPIRPLAGAACDWCRASPTYHWRTEISAARLAASLKPRGVQEIRSILPAETGSDGYPRFIAINGELQLRANAFRLAVGAGVLKSTRFTVAVQGDKFLFEGRGHGHGVGLCQWGARGLAKARRNWREILEYYYPGAELHKAY